MVSIALTVMNQNSHRVGVSAQLLCVSFQRKCPVVQWSETTIQMRKIMYKALVDLDV